jgi:energy-coupling factor transport system permease protein
MVMSGGVYLATTTLSAVKTAVARILAPIPGVRAGRIATMVGLTLAAIPRLMDLTQEIQAARRARRIDEHPPHRRVHSLVLPLARKVFRRADETAFAMEARLYTDDPRMETKRLRAEDWRALVAALVVASAAVML